MIIVVVGPPCAGKSSYVQKNAKQTDVRVDYDLIAKAFGSSVAHGSTGSIRRVALSARMSAINRILRGIPGRSWIIHTAPQPELIERYVASGARFKILDPGIDECYARAKRDDRPASVFAAIDNWYRNPPQIPDG